MNISIDNQLRHCRLISLFFFLLFASFEKENMNDKKFLEKKIKQRRVRFNLQTISSQPIKLKWTIEEFNDIFQRFRCSVTANYWQSLKQRVYEKSNHKMKVRNSIEKK